MERKNRRKFSADFKTKVVLESLKEKNTIEELARKHELHPNQISLWKKDFLSKASSVFESSTEVSEDKKKQEATMEKLYAKIGQQK